MATTGDLTAQPLIIKLLNKKGILPQSKLESLNQILSKDRRPPEVVLVKHNFATDRQVAEACADYFAVPLYLPACTSSEVDLTLATLLPEKLCRDHYLAPVAACEDTLDVVVVGVEGLEIIEELQLLTEMMVRPRIAPLEVVEEIINQLYSGSDLQTDLASSGEDEGEQDAGVASVDHQAEEGILDLDLPPPATQDGHIIRLVNQVLEQALRVGASDIHLEPFEDACAIRLRVDGVLRELVPPPKQMFVPMISRFKILAKMDIAEKRVPQDGAFTLKSGEKRIDLRVSTVPTVYGEKMVMRLLDKGAIPLDLTGLGFDERQAKDLIESIQMPHGLMLVTGPTGSGKSTTLYACLNLLNSPDTNICTVEDPVEYKFKGMNQVQVKTQVGLTFASALRAFLRQDPDVIMVGEVRDQETAQICLRAALTGHFVLSTIHTNDSLSAISRLEDMGIEPFLLASTLRVLEAQRLVRRLCQICKEPYDCDAETAKRFGLETEQTLYRSKGCEQCRGVGYRGRVGVFEVIRITQRMANLIQARAPLPDLRAAAREQGMKLLLDSGLDKARQGLTSLEEVLTVAMEDEE